MNEKEKIEQILSNPFFSVFENRLATQNISLIKKSTTSEDIEVEMTKYVNGVKLQQTFSFKYNAQDHDWKSGLEKSFEYLLESIKIYEQ